MPGPDQASTHQEGHTALQDSDNDVSRAQKAPAVHQQAAQMPSAATVGITSSQKSQQRPGQGPVRERAQPPPQVEHRLRVDYDALPKPQPYPLEGDVIAYRLLHIGADWTPQVILNFCALSCLTSLSWMLGFRLTPASLPCELSSLTVPHCGLRLRRLMRATYPNPCLLCFSNHSHALQSAAEKGEQEVAFEYMQVSEWREGRILSLDTAQQSVVVEPCGQNRTSQRNTQVRLRKDYREMPCVTADIGKDHPCPAIC